MSAPGRSIRLLARNLSNNGSCVPRRKVGLYCVNRAVTARHRTQQTILSARYGQIFARSMSDSTSRKTVEEDKEQASSTNEEDKAESETEETKNGSGEESAEESKEAQLETQVKELKDQLLRSLAEQENTRRIAKRDVEAARNFAVSSFAKSLLDTSDNLSRALDAVPPEYRDDTENHPVLATLYEGIQMTDENLTKAFGKNGLVKFGAVGESFDPNKHDALFEYPDESKEVGTIGQVMKVGFALNDRVLRPAEVGVVKKP
mmetsp:Transcript_28142/g.37521  ORF Transcript_28142/g.37521 Transcript_28142/m.37521 type:complete len:261 (-) Transcript_28142:6-788(-)